MPIEVLTGTIGISTKDLTPQVTNLTLTSGNAKINGTFKGVSVGLELVEHYRVVTNTYIPKTPFDGIASDIPVNTVAGSILSFVLNGLTNGRQYHVRVYIKMKNGRWQTSPDAKGVVTPQEIPSLLEDATWAQIQLAGQTGVASTLWSVGDEKNVTLTTGEVLTLQIYGFNHDDLTSGGKAPITFGLKNFMAELRRMNATATNSGGFTGSELYPWLQGTLYNSLPSDLRGHIQQVNKKNICWESKHRHQY